MDTLDDAVRRGLEKSTRNTLEHAYLVDGPRSVERIVKPGEWVILLNGKPRPSREAYRATMYMSMDQAENLRMLMQISHSYMTFENVPGIVAGIDFTPKAYRTYKRNGAVFTLPSQPKDNLRIAPGTIRINQTYCPPPNLDAADAPRILRALGVGELYKIITDDCAITGVLSTPDNCTITEAEHKCRCAKYLPGLTLTCTHGNRNSLLELMNEYLREPQLLCLTDITEPKKSSSDSTRRMTAVTL